MQGMNFITTTLLPNCAEMFDKELQQTLVGIIDSGCSNVFYNQKVPMSGAGGFGTSLSKYCLNNLFELCRAIPEGEDEQQRAYLEIRKKIAQTATPVLVNRCSDILKRFGQDEKKGGMAMPRPRIAEACFIIDKLKHLDSQVGSSKKQHLIQLMPVFAELVMTNEQELKEPLKNIFLEIASAIPGQDEEERRRGGGGGSSGGEF